MEANFVGLQQLLSSGITLQSRRGNLPCGGPGESFLTVVSGRGGSLTRGHQSADLPRLLLTLTGLTFGFGRFQLAAELFLLTLSICNLLTVFRSLHVEQQQQNTGQGCCHKNHRTEWMGFDRQVDAFVPDASAPAFSHSLAVQPAFQILFEFPDGAIADGRIRSQALEADIFEATDMQRSAGTWRRYRPWRFATPQAADHIPNPLAFARIPMTLLKRTQVAQNHIQHDSQRVLIRGRGRVLNSQQKFRGHIAECSEDFAGGGQSRLTCLLREFDRRHRDASDTLAGECFIKHTRQSKISQLGIALFIEEDVFRFDVAVQNAGGVQILHSTADLNEFLHGLTQTAVRGFCPRI